MFRIVIRATAGLAAACLLLLIFVTPAAARTGRTVYAPDQVGYAATGASFQSAEEHFTLPDAGRYARELGWLGLSVQLWSSRVMAELTAFACTDKACRPGGKPMSERYRLNLSLYDPRTHALICSTTATAARQRCNVQGLTAWNRIRIAPGINVNLDIYFNNAQRLLMADIDVPDRIYNGLAIFPGVREFDQARIDVQFGLSPFAAAPYRAPGKRQLLTTVGGSPYQADFTLTNGRGGYIASSLYAHHQVIMTRTGTASAHPEATPTGLVQYGTTFSIYLPR
jgi:hypothetical protein